MNVCAKTRKITQNRGFRDLTLLWVRSLDETGPSCRLWASWEALTRGGLGPRSHRRTRRGSARQAGQGDGRRAEGGGPGADLRSDNPPRVRSAQEPRRAGADPHAKGRVRSGHGGRRTGARSPGPRQGERWGEPPEPWRGRDQPAPQAPGKSCRPSRC